MASSRPPPSKSVDLDLTIVSAKHLKNVNWKNGDLKPYVVFWVDPERRLATKSDDSGNTSPVWNERFALPLPIPLHDSFLTLEIFHSKPSDTPKPLVATLRLPLHDLPDLHHPSLLRKFSLSRPSGRPHGKLLLKLGHLPRPQFDYPNPNPYPNPNLNPNSNFTSYRHYFNSPSPPPSPYAAYTSYPDSYSSYHPGYYSTLPPPPPPRPFFERYTGPTGPSAPLDYSSSSSASAYDSKPKAPPPPPSSKMGPGAGLPVGAVAGALSGLALEEGLRYEENKIADEIASAARDDYANYRVDY